MGLEWGSNSSNLDNSFLFVYLLLIESIIVFTCVLWSFRVRNTIFGTLYIEHNPVITKNKNCASVQLFFSGFILPDFFFRGRHILRKCSGARGCIEVWF